VSEQNPTDTVTVVVRWHETAHYHKTIEIPRADYERMRDLFLGDSDEVEALTEELESNHDLASVEDYHSDNMELDTFVGSTEGDEDDELPF
jgi:hypothetical protein